MRVTTLKDAHSSVAPTPGSSWAAMRPALFVCGGRSAARSNRKT